MKNIMRSKHAVIVAATASLCTVAAAQVPGGISMAGRKVAEASGPAVVTVHLVKKTTMAFEGQSSTRDSQSEIPGVVISPEGLTVTSLAAGDSSSMFGGPAGEGASARSDITEAKLIVANGDEIDAKVVLRDKDLDLLFLRPIKKLARPMKWVDLRKSTRVGLLDPVVLLTRLGKVVNRTLGAKLLYVQGVVEKPRKRYVISNDFLGGDFGSPVMALDGRIVGLLVVKVARLNTDTVDSPRSLSEGMASVVVTAADLLKTAAQAPADTAKAPGRSPVRRPTPPSSRQMKKNTG